MTAMQQALFGAILVQVALTVVLYLMLVRARFTLPRNELRPEMAYDQAAWPVKARLVANSVTSQFELPVLFFVGTLLALQFGAAGPLLVAFAWAFVVLRVAHAIVHTGKNIVMLRFGCFLAGFIALIGLWAMLAAHVFAAGL